MCFGRSEKGVVLFLPISVRWLWAPLSSWPVTVESPQIEVLSIHPHSNDSLETYGIVKMQVHSSKAFRGPQREVYFQAVFISMAYKAFRDLS